MTDVPTGPDSGQPAPPPGPPPGSPPGPPPAPPPGQQYGQAPYEQQPGYQGAPPPGIGGPADLTNRFLARLIDGVLLAVVNAVVVVTIVFGVLFSGTGGGMFGFGGFSLGSLLASVISAALYIGYFAFLESSRGQTLGKMILKLKVVGPDGQNPDMTTAFKRNAWLALSIIPFVGPLLQLAAAIYIAVTINSNTATRQGWHDQFAGGTSVIKIG